MMNRYGRGRAFNPDVSRTKEEALRLADEKQRPIVEQMWYIEGRKGLGGTLLDYPFFYFLLPILWFGAVALQVAGWLFDF